MKRTLVFMLMSWCISFGFSVVASADESVDIKTKMHGLWAEIYLDSGEILSYMYYLPEGKFHAFGYLQEDKGEFWFAYGDWKIQDDQSCIRFLFDTYGMMAGTGDMCVTVLSVTDDTFIYKDNEDGAIETLKRVSNGFLPEAVLQSGSVAFTGSKGL